jgi:hypothetical protein
LNAFSFNVIGSLNRLYFLRQAHLLKCLRILAIASKIGNKCCSFLGATKKILPFKVKKISNRELLKWKVMGTTTTKGPFKLGEAREQGSSYEQIFLQLLDAFLNIHN